MIDLTLPAVIAGLFFATTLILYGIGLAIEAARNRAEREQRLGDRWAALHDESEKRP